MAAAPPTAFLFPQAFQAAFAPNSEVVYVSAEAPKASYRNHELLTQLYLTATDPRHAPSAVLYDAARHWLFLIEAVPAHGPIGPARRQQLAAWAHPCPAGLLFITAFPDRAAFRAHAGHIAWETDVWLADAPRHLIHYNGARLLGPRQEAVFTSA